MTPFAWFLLFWMLLPLPLGVYLFFVKRDRARIQVAFEEKKGRVLFLEDRFHPVFDLESEISTLNDELRSVADKTGVARREYSEKRQLLDKLRAQVAVFDERIAFAEMGVYEPHFDFKDSTVYKEKILACRARQKQMVSAKTAAHCPNDWTVEGSRAKGQTMINRQMRLTMRAFNNECEAAIANARWNNVVAMEKRILNAAKQIDAANSSLNLSLNSEYVALKIDELHLVHENREQLKIERDERAELARAEREEKKLLAEAAAAEKQERLYEKLLRQAQAEAGVESSKIVELEQQLAEARAASERARAMAQMTRCGYVYVLSNIGSFGDDIVKIGLTRRLDPDDRVRELGDASVPFPFDTHAMIYSEDAPALENALHREFADKRVNLSNMRKEFFRVGLADIEEAVKRLAPEASFFRDREAQDFQETISRRREDLAARAATEADLLPEAI